VKAVEAGLAGGQTGRDQGLSLDVTGKKETLFVCDEGRRRQQVHGRQVHHERDRLQGCQIHRHLPYDILVSDNKVYALYARSAIAISFPDLSMMGANSS